MRLGSHVSIAGRLYLAVARAAAIGCQTMQIFSSSPRSWQTVEYDSEDIAEFKKRRQASGIAPLTIHLPYLVNLASPDVDIRRKSIKAIVADLNLAHRINADFLVVHTGSHRGAGSDAGLKAITESLKEILSVPFGSASLLLENTSGAGHAMGANMSELGVIFNYFNNEERLGLCMDTCHAFAAGYDVANEPGLELLFADIKNNFDLSKVRFFHFNDCNGALGSRLDRHEQIGKGLIGDSGFRLILSHPLMKNAAGVIETPKPDPDDDRQNLAKLRQLSM